jgi:hypothetical protein
MCVLGFLVVTGPKAKYEVSHAVQIIGYNNKEEWWLAKNSWGPGFADGGFFKVGFDAAAVCGDSWGLKFTPDCPKPLPGNKPSPSKGKPGCFEYKASSSDYVSKVAVIFKDWGLTPQQLLRDNLDKIKQPDMPLGGLTLTLCGVKAPKPEPCGAGAGTGRKLYVRSCDPGFKAPLCFAYKSAATQTGTRKEVCRTVKPDSVLHEIEGVLIDTTYPVFWYPQNGEDVQKLKHCSYWDGVEADFECPAGLKFYLQWCKTKPGTMCFRFSDGLAGKDEDSCYKIAPGKGVQFMKGMFVNNCYPVYWYFPVEKGQQPDLTPVKYVAYEDGYLARFDC